MATESMVSVEQLRALALELPAVAERDTWGHPTFRVRERIFVGMDEDAGTATVKATKETQQALIATNPATYGVAPRVGRHGWVQVHLAAADPDDIHNLVTEAWRLTAPTRMVTEYDRT